MMKKTKKFALYFSTGLIVLTGGTKVKLCKDESKTFTNKVILYTTSFTDDIFQIAAHRGFSSLEVENTLDAISLADSKNYIDYIEVDLRLTKDKKIVLSHNSCLLTLQNKSVKIVNENLDDLQNCKFYYPSIPLTNLQLNTDDINNEIVTERQSNLVNKTYELASLKDCIDESLAKKIILDLKFEDDTDIFISELEKEIDGMNINSLIFQSHDFESLLKLKEKHPEYNVSAIIKNKCDFKYIDFFDNLCVKKSLVNKDFVNTVIDQNKCIFVWTLNSPIELNDIANKFGDNYEDVIYITDYPDVIATCLHEKQLQKEKANH